MAEEPTEGITRMTLKPSDPNPHGAQSILATEVAAEAVEAAAAIGEALHPAMGEPHHARHLSGHGSIPDTIVIEKPEPVSQEEAAMLESVTARAGGGQIPKGGVAAHAQSAAARGESTLEIPVNQEVARQIQSLSSHMTESGQVPKGSFAAEVKSAADRLEQANLDDNIVRLTLQPPNLSARGAQSALATEDAAEAIEAAAAYGEALHSGHLSSHGSVPDTIAIDKASPVSKEEAAMLESVTATSGGTGSIPKGSVAAHAQSAAAKGKTHLEIPVNREVAREIQSLTSRLTEAGTVPKGSFASEVMSAADRLQQEERSQGLPTSGTSDAVSSLPGGPTVIEGGPDFGDMPSGDRKEG